MWQCGEVERDPKDFKRKGMLINMTHLAFDNDLVHLAVFVLVHCTCQIKKLSDALSLTFVILISFIIYIYIYVCLCMHMLQ